MSRKAYTLCQIAILGVMGALIGWSVTSGNAILPICAVFGGVGLMYLCGKRVRQVIDDERIFRIREKASRVTIGVFGPVIAVACAVLFALSKSGVADLRQAGFTLAYTACALMVFYYIFHCYYSAKS
ncbi:DUF2178 domain-containing protein [Chloroflexota bacterium]